MFRKCGGVGNIILLLFLFTGVIFLVLVLKSAEWDSRVKFNVTGYVYDGQSPVSNSNKVYISFVTNRAKLRLVSLSSIKKRSIRTK